MKTRDDYMRTGASITPEDAAEVARISAEVPGYSGERHYAFFKMLLACPDVTRLLILGVYNGRDVAFMLSVVRRYPRTWPLHIVGVDKFEDAACADWPEDRKGMNWAQAGFGLPPSFERSVENVGANVPGGPVTLIRANDADFLAATEERYDAVYLDTAHDHATVSRQLKQVRRVCNRGAVVCGDDYSDEGTWGVKRAVEEGFSIHHIFAGWIWFSSVDKLNP